LTYTKFQILNSCQLGEIKLAMKQKVQQENMVEKLNKIILTSIVFEST